MGRNGICFQASVGFGAVTGFDGILGIRHKVRLSGIFYVKIWTGLGGMGKFSTDQKIQLVQRIRAESMDNRMRMRSRERMLYGTSGKAEEEFPLYSRGYHDFGRSGREGELYALEENGGNAAEGSFSSFKLRLVLSVVLFTGFLLADAGSGMIAGISTAAVREEINKDFDTGLEEVVFDFEDSFPYTLFKTDSKE